MAEPKASLFSLRASGIIGGKRRGVPRRIAPEEPPPPPPPVVLGIFGDIIDSLEYDTLYGMRPQIIKIADTIYAIVYTGSTFDGWIVTVSIADDGTIAGISSFEFDTTQGVYGTIVHVSGDVYAIAYRASGPIGKMLTIPIDSAGAIGAVIDTLTFDGVRADAPFIFYVSNTVYGIAYQGLGNDGWVCSVDIQNNGQIGAAIIDSLEFDIDAGNLPRVIAVGGDYFAIAYVGGGINSGWIKTVEIDGAGAIPAAVTDSLEFDTGGIGSVGDIINLSGSKYAIVYYAIAAPPTGELVTLDIDGSGNIAAAVTDSWQWESVNASIPRMTRVVDTIYVISYPGPDADGWMKTLEIANDGTITKSDIDSKEFDEVSAGAGPQVIRIEGDTFAVAYQGVSSRGWLKTFTITTG